jgi:hypothetical protein
MGLGTSSIELPQKEKKQVAIKIRMRHLHPISQHPQQRANGSRKKNTFEGGVLWVWSILLCLIHMRAWHFWKVIHVRLATCFDEGNSALG